MASGMASCQRLVLKKTLIVPQLFIKILFFPGSCTRRIRNKKKIFRRILIIFVIAVVFYIQFNVLFQRQNVIKPCILPNIDFYDKSLDAVFWHIATENCDHWEDLVIFDENGGLRRNGDAIKRLSYTNLTCGYSTVDLYDQNNAHISDKTVYTLPSYTESDFVHAKCHNAKGQAVYSNLLYKIDNKTVFRQRKLGEESKDQLSIIILGLDSVSRLVAERKLPLTLPYFRDKLGAYVMKGYTKVGDNTFPNLLAMLTGKTLLEAAIPTLDYPQIYRDVINKGYIDCYAEDWTSYFPLIGFKFPYYTHYLRKLFLARLKAQLFMNASGATSSKSPLCFGNKQQHQILIDYCQKCVDSYKNKLKYIFMWQNEIGHHQSNKVQYADEDLKTFLQRLNDTNQIQHTVVVLCADHGPRYGPVVKNDIGRLTGRLPLLAILLPEQIKQRFPHIHQNMLRNTEKLTTPFDLHETLKDIIHQNFGRKENLYQKEVLPRGISLFQNIPEYRSCYDAGVSGHYCPCYSFSNVPIREKAVIEVSNHIVASMNEFLSKEKENCAKLKLFKIHSAKIQHAPKTDTEWESSTNYVVVLETVPGGGLFEATTRYFSSSKMKLLGDVNRINEYGNQSSCITDHFLHLYCYCKQVT